MSERTEMITFRVSPSEKELMKEAKDFIKGEISDDDDDIDDVSLSAFIRFSVLQKCREIVTEMDDG